MKRFWIIISMLIVLVLVGCGGGDTLTADAGDDFSIQVGDSPTFDGCDSTGDIGNYRWTIIEAPPEMAEDSGKVIRDVDANCSFTLDAAMGLKEVGDWIIELEVSDSAGQTATDRVTVTVNE